jgi:hypothetical protein
MILDIFEYIKLWYNRKKTFRFRIQKKHKNLESEK